MKVSKLPGFNAEASLPRRNARFQSDSEIVSAETQETYRGLVQPALAILRGKTGFCVDSVFGFSCCSYKTGECFDVD